MRPVLDTEPPGEQAWQFRQITDLELGSFQIVGTELSFHVQSDEHSLPFVFSLGGGQLIRAANQEWECDVLSHQDDWIDLASWLSMHPPAFFASDKSSFQGMNSFPPPATVATKLADGDAVGIDWSGCAISTEYETEDAGGLLTVHQALHQRLKGDSKIEVLVYDHRSGEAADFIALTREPGDRIKVSLYHCKGAGGAPSGGRVTDVYEVTCQLLKSVVYCDAEVLANHIEHRVHQTRHKHPSTFLRGDLDLAKKLLLGTPTDRVDFAVFAVQPGISKAQIDDHLADLMAFSLDYVLRGGAATGGWLVNV